MRWIVPTVGVAAALVAGSVAAAGQLPDAGTPQSTEPRASFGWPLRPFHRPHPVRGGFGDPRDINRSLHVLHVGVDIAAADGTPVYAVAPGVVHREGAQAVAVAVPGSDVVFGYWHVVPAVANGETVVLHELLGHVARSWGHVHFAQKVGGRHVNPLRPAGLGPYVDRTRPQIADIRIERSGRAIEGSVSGAVDLVASAFDSPPLPVPPPRTDTRLTPALVRWRIAGGGSDTGTWKTAFDVRAQLPARSFEDVYAAGTHQNFDRRAGAYRFYLARELDTRALANGVHVVQVMVSDTRGNRSSRRLAFNVDNHG